MTDPETTPEIPSEIFTDAGTNSRITIPKITEDEWLALQCGSDNLSGFNDNPFAA